MVVDLSRYPSHQIKLINEFDLAMVERNVNLLEKYLHKDYRHVILPKSLGKPAINRDEWLASITQVFGTPIQFERVSYTGCHLILTQAKSLLQPTYHSVVEAPGKVVLHVRIPIHSGQLRMCLM